MVDAGIPVHDANRIPTGILNQPKIPLSSKISTETDIFDAVVFSLTNSSINSGLVTTSIIDVENFIIESSFPSICSKLIRNFTMGLRSAVLIQEGY